MNKRFLTVLVFAFVVAGVFTLMFYKAIAGRINTAAKPATTKIIVANRTLGVGTLIRDLDLTYRDWAGPVPQQAVTKKEDVIGRGVISAIYEGEPILETRLAPKGSGAGLAATIPNGMRAVGVKVNEIIGLAGFVVPGMRVDVIISGAPPESPKALGMLSKTLLQNIEVLSAGQNIQKDAEGKPISVQVVNLLVTPEQAEKISLAQTNTQIQLVLRNPVDTDVAKTRGTSVLALFSGDDGIPMPAASKAPVRRAAAPVKKVVVEEKPKPKPPIVIEVLTGTKKTQAEFAAEGNNR
jgi:pilus assembly protein CpaB